ncbi:MAG: sigma-54-dependent Fis family transcriptional regulator [Candidatus Latescibacteria bacterium]|nr:sigma-54-dependent Fis family transcriptional regulator [Candidatus Latescibacterota bacterium]
MKVFDKILIVDDDQDVLLAARLYLKQHAEQVVTEPDPNLIPTLLQDDSYDVIMLDMNFAQDATSGKEGFHWLKRILEIDPSAVVILITAYGGVETAVQAIKEGAVDFVLKPWQNEKLLATLSAASKLRKSQLEVGKLRAQQAQLHADLDGQFPDMVGTSAAMMQVFDTIQKVGQTDANVLILGENGTGKDAVARALHRQSERADQAFIRVDLGAVSESLFESELFGHKKGAFTDAKADRAGRFEIASGGTLFLDEICNLSLPLQAKLLTVLETRTVTRLGTNKAIPIDVRLVCATNMPVHDMVNRNEFRQDLLYRVNTVELHLPALRERLDDIPLLVDSFLETYAKKYHKPNIKLQPAALDHLTSYQWPGNIRELQHAIERAVIMNEKGSLKAEDFLLTPSQVPEGGDVHFEDFNLERVEKTVIRKAIEKYRGNISQAAKELGLTRSALYRRLEKYGL